MQVDNPAINLPPMAASRSSVSFRLKPPSPTRVEFPGVDRPTVGRSLSGLLNRNSSFRKSPVDSSGPKIARSLSFTFKRNTDLNGKKQQKQPTSLLRYAKRGKFDEILDILKTEDEETIAAWLVDESIPSDAASADHSTGTGSTSSTSCGEYNTLLHKVVFHRPPVEVVDLLCKHLSKLKHVSVPEDVVDAEGKNPLHIAAQRGCDISVIKRLLDGTGSTLPARTIDDSGRTALHWACTHLNGPGFYATTKNSENAIKTVHTLIKAYPHAKVIKDKIGLTPLFLAEKYTVDNEKLRVLKPTREQIRRTLSGISSTLSNSFIDNCDIELPYEVLEANEVDDASSLSSGYGRKEELDEYDEWDNFRFL